MKVSTIVLCKLGGGGDAGGWVCVVKACACVVSMCTQQGGEKMQVLLSWAHTVTLFLIIH